MGKIFLPKSLKYFGKNNLMKCRNLREIVCGSTVLHRSDESIIGYPDLENISIFQFFGRIEIVEFGQKTIDNICSWEKAYWQHIILIMVRKDE